MFGSPTAVSGVERSNWIPQTLPSPLFCGVNTKVPSPSLPSSPVLAVSTRFSTER